MKRKREKKGRRDRKKGWMGRKELGGECPLMSFSTGSFLVSFREWITLVHREKKKSRDPLRTNFTVHRADRINLLFLLILAGENLTRERI